MFLSIRSLFNKNANITLLIRSFRKEFEVKVYIKKEKKIKKIIITTINNIINRICNANVEATLSIRKNIIIVKKQFNIVIFRVKTKKSKQLLNKKNIIEYEFTQNQLQRNNIQN